MRDREMTAPRLERLLHKVRTLAEQVRITAERVHRATEEAHRLAALTSEELRKSRELSRSHHDEANRVRAWVKHNFETARDTNPVGKSDN